ncbi:hypothetical protein INT44_006999 [Umbelopsis vinacea]|uniref:Uncharacterized protein n=1 Tax=Umbelopsis vinacea TaxID=44442 RepID=A0A8H7PGT4_9FUNG|nr:hypothetical protein INT44_006999 [Umbelopsis vinacea]
MKALFKYSRKSAPPRPMSKPVVDITPSLRFVAQIRSSTETSLADLNQKTDFLLAMAAFLRPSDLERISLPNSKLINQGDLQLTIVAPKELRAGRRITKTFVVRKNTDFKQLCPVRAFISSKHHPKATGRPHLKLLVNSKDPSKTLRTTTISNWLHRIVSKSTSQKPVPSVLLPCV